jgi:nucleotide-binding universal stress UspA family protein
MIQRILLGYDGSESSVRAFDLATEMTRRHGARLYVVVVAQALGAGGEMESSAVIEHSRDHHKGVLQALRDHTDLSGVEAQVEMLAGSPAQRILEQAKGLGIDLIVVGHRGHGASDRWRPGSVTHQIISHAECAVLVAR